MMAEEHVNGPKADSIREYDEIRIRIWETVAGRYLVFANGAACAAAVVSFEKPISYFRQQLDKVMEEELRLRSRSSRGTREQLRQLGRELYTTLLPKPIENCLDECRTAAGDRGLRVRFEVSPELTEIPFEILCSPATKDLGEVSLRSDISPVRSLPKVHVKPLRIQEARGRHLMVPLLVAAPSKAGELRVVQEIDGIAEAMPLHIKRKPLRVLGSSVAEKKATKDNISNMFRGMGDKICAALIIAHGKYDSDSGVSVVCETDDGSVREISGDILASTLAQARGLRLVVLNLCLGLKAIPNEYLSDLAHRCFKEGIPAVVAMQSLVGDEAASKFSPALFGAIYANQTIDEAVWAGRLAMAPTSETRIEWATPVFLLHENVGHGWLFKVRKRPVKKGKAVRDRLLEYENMIQGINSYDAEVALDDYEKSAPFLRVCRRWETVKHVADVLEGSGSKVDHRQLRNEVLVESQVDSVKEICKSLSAGDDPGGVEGMIAEIYSCVSSVAGCLEAELPVARDLFSRFSKGREYERTARWAAAAKVFSGLPVGYRDVEARRDRCEGESALEDRGWENAILHFSKLPEDKEWGATRQHGVAFAGGCQAEKRARSAGDAGQLRQLEEARRCYESIVGQGENTYRDTDRRLLYVEGWLAEVRGEWDMSRRVFRNGLLRGFHDVARRRRYAIGRFAEDRKWWRWAAKVFEASSYRDSRVRGLYAQGRLAEARADWQSIVSGFDDLPDNYREWDVGRRRYHALAQIAEADGISAGRVDWNAVAEPLKRIPKEFRRGRALSLLYYARARSCGDWADAVVALELLEESFRDVRFRGPYAKGRAAEAQAERSSDQRTEGTGTRSSSRDWLSARDAYAGLIAKRDEVAADLRDVEVRHLYVDGRWSESQGEWQAAADRFRLLKAKEDELPAGYRLVGLRALYAGGRAAEARVSATEETASRPEWAAAAAAYQKFLKRAKELLEPAEELPQGLHDVEQRCPYALGRLAETDRQWDQASDSYGECLDYRDADYRRGYSNGRRQEDAGEWSQACSSYLELEHRGSGSGKPGIRPRRERLELLLRELPRADGLASAGLAIDPFAEEQGLLPYHDLRESGVTPASPAREIKNASFAAMEKGALTEELREAWNLLRNRVSRMRVDLLVYSLVDPERLRRWQQGLEPGSLELSGERLNEELAEDGSLILALQGRRGEAIEHWRSSLTENPRRLATAWAFAAALYWQASELSASEGAERAQEAWREALALWARLLCDEEPWPAWCQKAASRYGQDVRQQDIRKLRQGVGEALLDELGRWAARSDREKQSEAARIYRRLALAFETELAAARLLRDTGGLPLVGGGARVVCGPAYLHYFGLGHQMARRVLQLEAEVAGNSNPEPPTAPEIAVGGVVEAVTPERLFRLRCAFSSLGATLLLLDREQPEKAIRNLPDLYQRSLAEIMAEPETCTPDESHWSSCPRCEEFLRRDPAYLRLPNRRARLLQDAVQLAVQAYLAKALDVLGRRQPREAIEEWRRAIEISKNAGAQVRTQQTIVEVVLGRADALSEKEGESRGERLTEAVELLEGVVTLVRGARARAKLFAKLSNLLTLRGVWFINGCFEYEGTAYPEKAIVDLRRALQLTPSSLFTRDNLCRALNVEAANLSRRDRPRRLFELLGEAIEHLHVGLGSPGNQQKLARNMNRSLALLEEGLMFRLDAGEVLKRMREADVRRRTVVDVAAEAQELVRQAKVLEGRGHRRRALLRWIDAARLQPADGEIRGALLSAVQREAGKGVMP